MYKFEALGANDKKWYEEYPKEILPCKHSLTEFEILKLKEEAKKHLDGETAAFQLKQSKIKNSETEWLRTALSKGTHADKIAAAIVLIQDNSKYNLSRLANLVSQVKGSKHSQSNLLITSLRDLFQSDLLHPHHKLLKFEEQQLDSITSANNSEIITKDVSRKKLLSHWYFEDQLREEYNKFVMALSAVASDTVEKNREKAISTMADLLIANSEQEHKLLEVIVNKIGDPQSKVASKAVFCLNKLLKAHPNMKMVVLKEVEKLLFRSNIAARAQYYGICLLTQFVLDQEDIDTATKLIDVYFAFFKACLKKGEPDSRMMAALLSGVSRAYRFAKLETDQLNDHIDSLYKVVHIGSFNVSLSSLGLLHQLAIKNPLQERRFYTAFYRKLLDPQIAFANKRAVFLNLLFRVMKSDKSVSRLYAFVKRVLQICLYFPVSMACATLYVISQILKIRKDLRQVFVRSLVEFKKENDEAEEKADKSEGKSNDDDVQVLNNYNTITLQNIVLDESEADANPSNDDIKVEDDAKTYDPFCINPSKSGAITSPLVELAPLIDHYHPSVALFAKNILEGKTINYTGDPLEDLTLIRFLDRFVFKNPKKVDEKRINTATDPLAIRAKYVPQGLRSLPISSEVYLNEDESCIPVDELYLYRYLRKRNEKRNVKKEDNDSDHESVNSEEFNNLMDRCSGEKDLEEIDFASEIQSAKKRKNKSQEVEEESDEQEDSEEEFDDDDDDDDEGMDDLDDMSDIDFDDVDDDDMSDIEFDDEDNEDEISLKKSIYSVLKKENLSKSSKNAKSSKEDKPKVDDDVFISADESVEMNEEYDENNEDEMLLESTNLVSKKGRHSKSFKTSKKGKNNQVNDISMSAEVFGEMLEKQGRSKQKQGSSNMLSDADGASIKQLDWETKRHDKIRGKYGGKKNFKNKKGFKAKNVKLNRK